MLKRAREREAKEERERQKYGGKSLQEVLLLGFGLNFLLTNSCETQQLELQQLERRSGHARA